MIVNNKLKLLLLLQSFCPLFVLVFIQHVGHFELVLLFFKQFFHGDFSVLNKAIKSSAFGDVLIMIICAFWIIASIIIAFGFRNLENGGFDSHSEKIVIKSEKNDSGVTFFVSFILPLLVEDVSTIRGLILFVLILVMVIYLLQQSNLFYQNPILYALKYRTYEFSFVNPYDDVESNKTYIGITRKSANLKDAVIKRKSIADNVFFIYNE